MTLVTEDEAFDVWYEAEQPTARELALALGKRGKAVPYRMVARWVQKWEKEEESEQEQEQESEHGYTFGQENVAVVIELACEGQRQAITTLCNALQRQASLL